MNKLVNIYNNKEVLKVLKIDTATQDLLKTNITLDIEIAGGLKGIYNKENNNIDIVLPKVNFILKEDEFGAVRGFTNVRLNGSQTKDVLNGKEIELTTPKIENVVFKVKYDTKEEKFSFTHNFENISVSYYTENNQPLNK